MSVLSRAGIDVQRAMAGWRWGREEKRRERIDAVRPLSRQQRIADIRRGLACARSLIDDIRNCRANRLIDPFQYVIDRSVEPYKRSMLVAQIEHIEDLLDFFTVEMGRAVVS